MANTQKIIINNFKIALQEYLSDTGVYWYEENSWAFINKKIDENDISLFENLLQKDDFETQNIHKLIYNTHCYIDSLKFGFQIQDMIMDEYGWIKLPNKIWTKKRIQLTQENYIDIWQGKNNTFTYGLHYCLGASGGCGSPSQFGTVYNSYEDAKAAAITEFNTKLSKAFESRKTDSCGNYNLEILNKLQKAIIIEKSPKQLSLF